MANAMHQPVQPHAPPHQQERRGHQEQEQQQQQQQGQRRQLQDQGHHEQQQQQGHKAQEQHQAADASSPLPPSVPQLLRQFLHAQQQRAQQYAALERSFRLFLDTKKEFVFTQAVQQATHAFSACSQQVIAAETSLRQDHQRPDLAALLRTVQEQEREKLRATLSLQSLRQAHAFRMMAFQHQGDEEDAVALLEPSALRACGCGHDAQHQHGQQQAAEPSRAEYEGAVREVQLLLDACMRSINDAIEEAREVLLAEEGDA